ncbi:MAG: nucleotidyltransferase domain-containing protein [Armatimonadetes bacterium]|nr:nucleotidyltransferase domain-containing protein [Armatimonadota bacterium]
MENKYLLKLKEIVIDFLKDEEARIILFGSRARKEDYISSDIDIGIIPYRRIDQMKITLLREKIENLNIPYKVEIVNFQDISEDFKHLALKDAVIWKD